jgi:protein-glutamine gamma-glutamyltransferase
VDDLDQKLLGVKQNGIDFIGNTKISMKNKMHMKKELLVLQIFLIIAGVYGTVFGFISAFTIEANTRFLITTIIISTIIYCFIYKCFNSIRYVGLFLFVIYIISAYTFRHEIFNGLLYLENKYIEQFNYYYSTNVYKYIVGDYEPKQVITIFLTFIIILLTGLLSCVVFKNTLQTLFLVNTLPIILLSFTVGLIPGAMPFTAFLACCIGIYGLTTTRAHKSFIRRRKIKKTTRENEKEKRATKKHNLKQDQRLKYVIGLKVGGVLAVALIFLFLILSFVVTPKLYKEKVNVISTKQKIQNSMMNFSIDNLTNQISNIKIGDLVLFHSNTATGGLSEGKLGEVGKLKYKNETALKVTTSVTGYSSYLKGFVGSEYKRDRWVGLSEEDKNEYKKIATIWDNSDFDIMNQSSYFMSLIKNVSVKYYPSFKYLIGNMKVENVNANPKYIYSPYFSSYPLLNDLEDTDGTSIITTNMKKKQYYIDFYANADNLLQFNELNEYSNFNYYYKQNKNQINEVNNIKTLEETIADKVDEYRTFESVYKSFVYDVYTKVPEGTLRDLKKQFRGIKYSEYRDRHQDAALPIIILLIRKFFDENTSYSLEPGILPKDKDFIEYFLFENRLGYCTHYASAATMILRIMGVPARYVEGYIIKESDVAKGTIEKTKSVEGRYDNNEHKFTTTNKTINVLDSNAHAWVEIYIDGFGWVPVEFTPGYSADITMPESSFAEPESTMAGNFESNNNQEMEEINKKNNKITPTPTAIEKEIDGKDVKLDNSIIDSKNKGKSSSFYLMKMLRIVWHISVVLGLVIMIILLRSMVIRFFRNNRLKSMNHKQKVIMLYSEITKILEHYKVSCDDDLTEEQRAELVEKDARFMEKGGYKNFTRIALKAKFDRMKLSNQELEEADNFYREMIQSIYKKATYKEKLFLKYIKNFY